jgi:hypothetical protein
LDTTAIYGTSPFPSVGAGAAVVGAAVVAAGAAVVAAVVVAAGVGWAPLQADSIIPSIAMNSATVHSFFERIFDSSI